MSEYRYKIPGVARHLHFAWVEFGDPRDGISFCSALQKHGWQNLVQYLPRGKDRYGAYYQDPHHPILPIRWTQYYYKNKSAYMGGTTACLIRPNTRSEADGSPWIDDPLLKNFREAQGEDSFEKEVKRFLQFLSQWMFVGGIKRYSDTDAELTIGPDATHYADILAVSGHGMDGDIWGGDQLKMRPFDALLDEARAQPAGAPRYVLIPTCYNLSDDNMELDGWPIAMRQQVPVHGFFGYRSGYPGLGQGGDIYRRFAAKLASNGYRKRILEAYREAHVGKKQRDIWAAVIHSSSLEDNLRDMMQGTLPRPDPQGGLLWFCEDNWPDGQIVEERPKPYIVRFYMQDTRVDRTNKKRVDVGLFPGEHGSILLGPGEGGSVLVPGSYSITFYWVRPQKDETDLERTVKFDTLRGDGWTCSLIHGDNDANTTDHVDCLYISVSKPLSEVRIPFVVQPDVHEYYPLTAFEEHGFFWVQLLVYDDKDTEDVADDLMIRLRYYRDGIYLRPPRAPARTP